MVYPDFISIHIILIRLQQSWLISLKNAMKIRATGWVYLKRVFAEFKKGNVLSPKNLELIKYAISFVNLDGNAYIVVFRFFICVWMKVYMEDIL